MIFLIKLIKMKTRFTQRFFLLFFLFLNLIHGYSQTATFSSTTSGDFDNPVGNPGSPWIIISGTDPDGIPDRYDEIIINVGDEITADASAISEVSTFTNDGTLILNSTYEFRVWGSNNSSLSPLTSTNNGTISGSGVLYFITNNEFSNSGTIPSSEIKAGYGTTEFISDLTVNGRLYITSSGVFKVTSGNTLTINGKVYGLSGTSLINEGTMIVNDSRFFNTGISSSLCFTTTNGLLNWNNSADLPNPVNSSFKDLTISTSCSYASNYNITGNLINNATFTPSSDDLNLTFNGSISQSISGTGQLNIKKLTLNNSNGLTLSCSEINIDEVMESTSGAFNQNGSNITLKSSTANNGGLIKVNNETDYTYTSGNFIVERYFNATSNGWRMICSPVKTSTLLDVDDEFIFCGIAGATAGNNFVIADCGHFYNVITYNESSDDYSEVTTATQSISSGNGTLIYTSAGEYNLLMGGARSPNFDDISYGVTTNGEGYNLVSNPYPATLDWSAFESVNDIESNHWIFSGDAGNFLSSSNDIPHSQGFFVKANSAGNLTFNVGQTTNSNTATFVKSENGVNLPLSLKVSSDQNSYYDYAHIHAAAHFSAAYDSSFEISKFYTPYPDYAPNIFFLDSDSNDLDRICVNNNQDINIFFDVKPGRLAEGNYSVNFENISKFMIGSCMTVEDLHTGQVTDLRTDSLFTFNSDTLAASPRFKISIEVDYDIQVVNSNCFQDSSAIVKIFGDDIQGSYFILLDSLGLVVDSVIANGDSLLFDNLNSGVFNFSTNYTGRCSLDNQEIIILEPENIISNFITSTDTFFLDYGNVDVYFNNNSQGSSAYLWDFGDGTFSTLKDPIHQFNLPGEYTVSLTSYIDSSLLCQDFYSKSIYIETPILLNTESKSLTNSSISYFNNSIHFENFNDFKYVSIFDINGKLLIKRNFSKTIFIDSLIKGLYIVSLESDDYILNQKLIVN